MTNKLTLKISLLLFMTITLWASAFVGIRAGLESYTPGGLALLRYGVASICMFFIYRSTSKKERISVKDKLLLMLVGAVGIGWYNVLLNDGEVSVTSATSSFIISQSPIMTSILAIFFLKERGNVLSFLGMSVSLFGVFLISVGEAGGLKWDAGISYLFFATLCSALYSIMQKPFLKKYHAIDVTAYVIWGCAFSLIVYTPDVMQGIKIASLQTTLIIVYLGVFPAAIAYVAWSYILVAIPASRAVSFLYFAPILTTLLGWIFLKEIPAVISLMGGVIAMSGVWVVNHSYRRKLKTALAIES